MHLIIKSALLWAAAIAASFTLIPTSAHAKQCIWNKGGFVLNIAWFRPEHLGMLRSHALDGPGHIHGFPAPNGRLETVFQGSPAYEQWRKENHPNYVQARAEHLPRLSVGALKNFAPPVQTASISAGFGNCTPTHDTLVALVTRASLSATTSVLIEKGTPLMTWAEDGTRRPVEPILCSAPRNCHAPVDMIEPAITGDALVLFSPPHTHYVDFWGTIWDTQWGQGGPIR